MAAVGPDMAGLPTQAGLGGFFRILRRCFLCLWGLRSRFDGPVRLNGKAVGRSGAL